MLKNLLMLAFVAVLCWGGYSLLLDAKQIIEKRNSTLCHTAECILGEG